MKHKCWPHIFLGWIFAFALSAAAVGCVITGFDLPVTAPWNWIMCCGAISAVCALLCRFRSGGFMIPAVLVFLLSQLLGNTPLWDQLQTVLHHITTFYHRAYDWPILGAPLTSEVDLAMMAGSVFPAALVSFCVNRRKPILPALLSVILPLVSCLVVTDTVPDVGYVYLLILGVSLLLLTDWVRRNHPRQIVRLCLRITLPVAAVLAAIFALNPQNGYINHGEVFQNEVLDWFSRDSSSLTDWAGSTAADAAVSRKLSLRGLGPRSDLALPAMEVTSPTGGTVYLRGQDFDRYTGEGWEAGIDRSEAFPSGTGSGETMTIRTNGVREIRYLPYYSSQNFRLTGGRLKNDAGLVTYQYTMALSAPEKLPWPDARYTGLPESTLEWAVPLVESLTGTETVSAIGEYVQNLVPYDRNTARMPRNETDFARWFLTEADRGYCVHFATAATVLLRAAGIPARYVEGYMFTCTAGETAQVTSQDAHAWVEYYDAESCTWEILDATPPDESGQEEITLPETEPTTLPPLTEPTAPTASDLPAEAHPAPSHGTPTVPTPTESTTPPKEPFRFPQWAKNLVRVILAAALCFIQGELRIYRKEQLWNLGEPNPMALTRWRLCQQTARVLKQPVPEELEALAQKAKFSQHNLTPAELAEFDTFRQTLLELIATKPLPAQWFLRCIFAIGAPKHCT